LTLAALLNKGEEGVFAEMSVYKVSVWPQFMRHARANKGQKIYI